MRRRKTLQEKCEELKTRVLQDGRDWESWHLEQNVSPRHLEVGKILNPAVNPLSNMEHRKHGGYTKSEIAKCESSGLTFKMSLKEFLSSDKFYVRCEKCERKIRIRIRDEATFTKEHLEKFPYEMVDVYVCFHRIAAKPRMYEMRNGSKRFIKTLKDLE
jgi:hypothetical protein